jgi:hypothetical protein
LEGNVDLTVTMQRSAEPSPWRDDCDQGNNPCIFERPLLVRGLQSTTNETVAIRLLDRDILFDDDLGTVTVTMRDLIGTTPVERRSVAAADCDVHPIGSGNVQLTACVRVR